MNQSLGRAIAAVGVISVCLASLPAAADDRWYSPDQVTEGKNIYITHCAACHGASGEGQPDWDQRDPITGYYPAPPLDGSGHASGHTLANMRQTLTQGGGPLGGTMPSFVDVLDQAQMDAVLAYVQSLWPDETYARWVEIEAGRATAQAGGDHKH
jgi:mono/diheme cytochrome c family protein